MNDIADLSRRLESLLRYGTIAAVQLRPPRVRVKSGGLTTDWLPWLALRAGTTRHWSAPSVGEQCLALCPSGEPATGLVLLGIYSLAFDAPSDNPEEHLTLYPDGASIRYNHASGALDVTGIKTATVQASQLCTVDCPQTDFTGNVHIKGGLVVDGETLCKSLLSYLSGLSGQGGDSGEGGGTFIRGPIRHSGDFHHGDGSFASDTVLQDGHHHRDSIGGDTGEPL